MKKRLLISLLLAVMVLSGCSAAPDIAKGPNNEQASLAVDDILKVDEEGNTRVDPGVLDSFLDQANAQELSPAEREGIRFMMEEEKLARDVYKALEEKWGQPVFGNISESENTHIDAVRSLAEKYGIDISFYEDENGQFANQDLKQLYDALVEQGGSSLEEALRVGALIEEIDILDLEHYVDETNNADLKLVYENLIRGSRNHLRSFNRNMERQGQKYEPQRLGQEQFDEIVGSGNERGGYGTGGSQGASRRGQGQSGTGQGE